MAVSVRKPVLYAFGVVLCAGIIGGIWLWYRTHCVLITNDSRIEGTLVGVASRLSAECNGWYKESRLFHQRLHQ